MIQYSVKPSVVNPSNKSSSPQKSEIHDVLVAYFKDPIFYKVRDVGNAMEKQTYSMYANKAYCLSINECRYGIVFVKGDEHEEGHAEKLSNLNWVSFQLRTMTDHIVENVHTYSLYHYEPLSDAKIVRSEITERASIYECQRYSNIEVVLLHTKTKTKDSYQNSGNLASALATWETILNVRV